MSMPTLVVTPRPRPHHDVLLNPAGRVLSFFSSLNIPLRLEAMVFLSPRIARRQQRQRPFSTPQFHLVFTRSVKASNPARNGPRLSSLTPEPPAITFSTSPISTNHSARKISASCIPLATRFLCSTSTRSKLIWRVSGRRALRMASK